MPKMPTIYMPHGGGPCFFMDWNPSDTWNAQADYLRGIRKAVGQRPKALLIISGHWEEPVVTVQSNNAPALLFDYSGFPPHTYELEYPAPGDPDLAKRVTILLEENSISTKIDAMRGFDHGVFVPLLLAFPDADIPVVQLSLHADLDPAAHIAMGKALAPLRDEGVLIIGSGNSYHNMAVMMRAMQSGGKTAIQGAEFDRWLTDTVCHPDHNVRNSRLTEWADAPGGRDAHPREEHLMPLHVVAGAAGADIGKNTLKDTVLGAVGSGFQFG